MTELTKDRKEWLHGVFTTAFEGGIGYWSATKVYHIWENPKAHWSKLEMDLDGFYGIIEPSEDEWGFFINDDAKDKAPLRVDAAVIQLGVERLQEWMAGEKRNMFGGLLKADGREYLKKPAKPASAEYWEQFLESERTNGDEGDYDGDVADAVVQLGLFDEVVYG